MTDPQWKPETIAVHGGYRPDPTTRAGAMGAAGSTGQASGAQAPDAQGHAHRVPGQSLRPVSGLASGSLRFRYRAFPCVCTVACCGT